MLNYRGLSAVFFVIAVIALAACSKDDNRPAPTATVPVAQTQPASPGPGSSPAPTATVPAAPAEPVLATVVPMDVEGLETRTDSIQGDPYRYFATHPEIEAFPLLGETLNAAIAEERAAFEAVRGPFDPVPPEATGPSFNVSFDFLVASADVVGVHLLFYEFFGANGVERSATFWFDLASGAVLPPSALFGGDDDLAAITGALRDALLSQYGDLLFLDALDELLADPDENLKAIGFSPEGDLVVIFDEYSIGPGAIGRVTMALPADEIEPHLSEFGRRAQAETLAPSGPLRFPQPTPEPPPPTLTPTPTAAAPPSAGGADCVAVACIALTFDDGPAGPTLALLDVLAEADVPATFFVVGVNARLQPAVLARMIAEGHEIGNHSFDHKDLTTLSAEQIREQWSVTSEIISSATGVSPVLFRPPYGAINEMVASTVRAPFILWSVDPRDWADRDTAIVTQRVLQSARPGDIVLLHDIHVTSVNAVPAIINGLRERGFTFVTVSALLGSGLEAGQTYRRR